MDIKPLPAIETHRDFLRNEGWLARMPEDFRHAILSKAWLKAYEAGATILNVGEEPRGLFGVAEGRLRLAIAPGDTAPLFAHLFKPGDWFGEVPALTRAHHVIGLVATRDSILLHVPNHALGDILRERPSAGNIWASWPWSILSFRWGSLQI